MNACLRSLRQTMIVVIAGLIAGCNPAVTVMSLNVRYPDSEDKQSWELRRPIMARVIARKRPDLIGTQELFMRQGNDLVRSLPYFRWIGRDRYGAHADEHMGIFYNARRLVLEQYGDFWLSQTPDRPGSQSWGTNLPRMVTWARFHLRSHPGRSFIMMNTHFPHRDEDEVARTRAAELVAARFATISEGAPIVFTGDLNTTPDSAAYATLARVLRDVPPNSDTSSDDSTFHDFTGRGQRRLDYIMVRDFRSSASQVLHDHENAIYPSDHFPLVARLFYQTPPARNDRAKQGSP